MQQHQMTLQELQWLPNVAGVAIIRSYYPKLTASQVKHILMDSGVAITENVVVAGNQRQPFFYFFLNQEK
jgi:hypothetical protein